MNIRCLLNRKIATYLLLGISFFPVVAAVAKEPSIEQPNPALYEKLRRSAQAELEEIGRTMVAVSGGRFAMVTEQDGTPQQVEVADFEIGRFEVTQAQWRALMVENPSLFPGCDQCPVENVSWYDVQRFIQRLNGVTGSNYRLPTEAEWEYACRGGTGDEAYCGGSEVGEVAWYVANSNGRSQQVGRKKASAFGLHDMSGNVVEWLQDCWEEDPPSADGAVAQGGCNKHMSRGGYWGVNPWYLKSTTRSWGYTGARGDYLGFRLARSPR